MIVIKLDQEARRVLLVLRLNRGDVLLWRAVRGFCREHDGCAMGVVRAHVAAVVAPGALETNPDIRLSLLEHVSQMQRCVGIRQCRGHQNFSWGGTHAERDPAEEGAQSTGF